jgi:signal transduction histidine kinase
MGLRLRVILILTLPAVLAVGAHGFLRIRQEEADLVRENRENLELMARAVQLAVENALRDRQLADVRRLLIDMVERQELIDRIRLFDRNVKPTIVSNPLTFADTIPAGNLAEVMRTGRPEAYYQRGQPSVLYYLAPVRGRNGGIEGSMEIVRLASAVDRRRSAAVVDVIVRLTILLLVIVVTTMIVMQRQVLRPLARLAQAIEHLGRGPSTAALTVTRHDELGRVAESFNAMAARLDDAQRSLLEESERAVGLERELRRAATLAVAGRLASALAHEVGTPLNIVSGRAEVVLKSLSDGHPQRKDLKIIIAQIDRISRIIASVLDTVRMHNLELRPTAVAEVVDELLPLLHHTARQKGVELTAEPDADVPLVRADSGQLQQVLINLVLNAVEATPPDGRVVIKIERAKRESRTGVSVVVSDTGSGIAPEHLPRLFEPFFSTKPRGHGTGLGLPICRDIVQAHGGDISIETSAGVGTTVIVWLPESEEEPT